MALQHDIKITTVAPTATGTTTITGTALDMTGFDGAIFIARLGSPAVNNNLRVQQCDTTGGSYADLAGSKAGDHATDNPLIVEVNRPLEGFLKWQITRGTTTTIDAVTIIQYASKGVKPVTQPTGTQAKSLYHPAEGTA